LALSEKLGVENLVWVSVLKHPAYSVFCAGVPADAAGTVVPLSELQKAVSGGSFPPEVLAQLAELLQQMPGVPLGLTFDGGIAVTASDYRLAESRWNKHHPDRTGQA